MFRLIFFAIFASLSVAARAELGPMNDEIMARIEGNYELLKPDGIQDPASSLQTRRYVEIRKDGDRFLLFNRMRFTTKVVPEIYIISAGECYSKYRCEISLRLIEKGAHIFFMGNQPHMEIENSGDAIIDSHVTTPGFAGRYYLKKSVPPEP